MIAEDKPIADDEWSLRLIEALSRLWGRIRLLYPEVPPVVLLAAPAHHKQQSVLGHFSALSWKGKHQDDDRLHEVVVVAEHLDRPVEAILETLIHEAAHALNFVHGLKDCSASQYHNEHFRQAAIELGLSVERVAHYGWAKTKLAEGTGALYDNEVLYLRRVLIHRRKPMTPPSGGTTPTTKGDDQGDEEEKSTSRLRKAVCECGYIIRVSKKTITDTVIRCESCGEPFRLT